MSENSIVPQKEEINIRQYLNSTVMKDKFSQVLGDGAASYLTTVISIIQNNKDLQIADKDSVYLAAWNAASMKLPVNPNLGYAYIIPYKSKKKLIEDGKEKWIEEVKAQFQMGYKGYIQLGMRSQQYIKMEAISVHEDDTDETVTKRLTSLFTKEPPSGKPIGYISYFKLINGFEKTFYMSIEDLNQHGLKYSQSYKSSNKYVKESSKWATDFDAMAKKTVIKLLLSKFGPLTVDMVRAVATDQTVIKSEDGNEVEYIDTNPVSKEELAHERLEDFQKKRAEKKKDNKQ